ncbi:MAG: hypothetical protein R6X32_21570 [Chloroflexota bacterium]
MEVVGNWGGKEQPAVWPRANLRDETAVMGTDRFYSRLSRLSACFILTAVLKLETT